MALSCATPSYLPFSASPTMRLLAAAAAVSAGRVAIVSERCQRRPAHGHLAKARAALETALLYRLASRTSARTFEARAVGANEEVKGGALRAKFCNARGRTDEAIELWFQVLHKLTIAPDAPSDDPVIVKAITELKKANALSKSRLRALKLGPPARDSWLAINPFDRYWTPWFGGSVSLFSNWR